jgi:selenocysteine lyase/cysteine desulfurase
MAGTGTGVAYFKRDIQDQVYGDMWRPNMDPAMGARKYEISGQRHIPSARGMGDAVDFQNAIGKANIETRVHQLAERLKSGLMEIPGVGLGTSMAREMSGGLTTLYVEGVPKANIQRAVMERAGTYIVGSGLNDFACRVSTHLYNTPDQVDHVLAAIRHVAENRSQYGSSAA